MVLNIRKKNQIYWFTTQYWKLITEKGATRASLSPLHAPSQANPTFLHLFYRELKTSLKSGLMIRKVDVCTHSFFLHPTIFHHLHSLFNAWGWVSWRCWWCFNTCGDLLCCSFYLRTGVLVQFKEWALIFLLFGSSRADLEFLFPLFWFLLCSQLEKGGGVAEGLLGPMRRRAYTLAPRPHTAEQRGEALPSRAG